MGYNLYIGEAKINYHNEDGLESSCGIGAETFRDDNAPAYGEPTDYESMRWPSYTAWHNFCEFVDLKYLFYDENCGILRNHSGCVPLTKDHQEAINVAYENFKKKYPNAVAGYPEDEGDENWPEENSYLVRLEWLKFWVDYVLEKCERPVFANS